MANQTEIETIKGYVKQLQSNAAGGHWEEVQLTLELLKKIPVTEELLRATKAGVAVSKLKGCENQPVQELSKTIISRWKADVDDAKKKRGAKPAAATASPSPAATPSSDLAKGPSTSTKAPPKLSTSAPVPAPKPQTVVSSPLERKQSTDTPATYDPNEPRSVRTDNAKLPTLGDKTRDKCVEMIYNAIVFDSGAPVNQVTEKTFAIEKECYKEFGSTSNDYRSKIRRLIFNLKDKNNPSLRQAIASGDLDVARFCKMSNQEMASEERKQADGLLNAQNLHNSLAAGEQEAETDAFQCGRCKQRKTRYRQAQTRSADEPMTTFVTCVNCGNRWKFS